MAAQQRRLAAILMADIVGYSRLMGADEAGTIARLQALRGDVIGPVVAAHRGRIVKTLGDGFFVEVPSAVDAVNLAAALQERAAPSGLQLRIGVNLGDVVLDGEDLLGDGVNVAARLQELAAPGEICVSGKVRDEAQGRTGFAFEDIGKRALKNIAQPVQTYRLHPASSESVGAAPDVQAAPDLPSIVVLPFQNMSGDPTFPSFGCRGEGFAGEALQRTPRRLSGDAIVQRGSRPTGCASNFISFGALRVHFWPRTMPSS